MTSGSLLDDDHWHSVVIERYRRNVNFTLDHHTQHFRTNGEFDHLDLDYEVKTPVGDLLPLGKQGANCLTAGATLGSTVCQSGGNRAAANGWSLLVFSSQNHL